jgi:hypothetical protein
MGRKSMSKWEGTGVMVKHSRLHCLPGCELSGHTRSFTFKVEEEDDAEHMLALTMVRGRREV